MTYGEEANARTKKPRNVHTLGNLNRRDVNPICNAIRRATRNGMEKDEKITILDYWLAAMVVAAAAAADTKSNEFFALSSRNARSWTRVRLESVPHFGSKVDMDRMGGLWSKCCGFRMGFEGN